MSASFLPRPSPSRRSAAAGRAVVCCAILVVPVVLVLLMDFRGDLLTHGGPVVEHTKQTRLERGVVRKQWMRLMSVPFYDLVDAAVAEVTPADYATMFAHFVQEYQRLVPRSPTPPHNRAVYRQLGTWMARWSKAFV